MAFRISLCCYLDMKYFCISFFLATLISNSQIKAQALVDDYGFYSSWQSLSEKFRAGKLALNEQGLPSGYDTRVDRKTTKSLFSVKVKASTEKGVLPFNEIHDWDVEVIDEFGKPVSGAVLEFYGGMPLHNHGFPTEPNVTGERSPGTYMLSGVKFSMMGWWQFAFAIKTKLKTDTVRFNIIVEP